MKLGFFTLTISSVFLLLLTSSCLSLNFIRTPSSDPSDNFTNDAYEQAQTRNFGKGKISEVQVAHELAGRSIWFKSAPNERHHAYVFPQKVGVAIDWNQAFASVMHNSRFQTWGLINDPDCCIPGINCDQKNMRFNGRAVTTLDTFGWEYCKGDEGLLDAVRNGSSYRDPACDDPVIKAADALDSKLRESRCELQFGTSTGAIGYRKFPNPTSVIELGNS